MNYKSIYGILLGALVLVHTTRTDAGVYGSRNSGSWSGSTTWYMIKTGTITVTSGSTTVTGTGTAFQTDLSLGDTIVLDTSPKQAIGRVASLPSNSSLTLVAAATSSGSGAYGRYTNAYPSLTTDTAMTNSGDSVWCSGTTTIKNFTVRTGSIFEIDNLVGFSVTGSFVLNGTWRGTGVLHMSGDGVLISGTGKSLDAGSFQLDKNNAMDTVLASTNLDMTSASLSVGQNTGLYNRGTIQTSNVASSNSTSKWTNTSTGLIGVTGSFMSANPGGVDLTAAGNTVAYNGAAQTVTGLSYSNLTLAGSGSKTISGVTVNGALSMQGTATASAAPTYGPSAALEYKGSSQQTTGAEFLASMPRNVFINNPGGVLLGAPKALSGTLTFVNGNLFLGTYNLTLSGSVSGAGATRAMVTNSTGGVVRNISGGNSVQYAVSTDGTDYNPIGISLNLMDPSDNFTVRVAQGVSPAATNNQCAVQRTWTITEGTGGGNHAALTFQWDAAQEGTSFVRSSAGMWLYGGSAWNEVGTNNVSGSGPYTLSLAGFIATSFGSFIVGNDGTLPITLSTFTAVENGSNGVVLNWATVSEVNNYGFELERSIAPTGPFTTISPLIPGHGTTNVAQHYSYTDGGAPTGSMYYRLKQTDLDRTARYSDPILVNRKDPVGAAEGFALRQNYPNPFNPTTEIRFIVSQSGPALVQVFNTLGQQVTSLFNGDAEAGREYILQFNGAGLASGMYFCRLQSGEKTEIHRMVMMR